MVIRKTILGLVLSGIVMAMPSLALGQAVWSSGTVTKEAWKDQYAHIEVNDIPYTLMPEDVRIAVHYQAAPGIYTERKIKLDEISLGQKVMIRAQGHRIYEILIVR